MAVTFVLVGPNGIEAQVSPSGELVVGPVAYDDTEFNELAEPNTGYNFFAPLPSKQFVITSVWFRADKQVSSTVDATVVIYEAEDTDTTTVDKVLLQYAVVQGDIVNQPSLRTLVNQGKFINAKTDDDDVHMNLGGHYIEELT